MKTCLYCNTQKDESEFSEEHVIPQGIGGNLAPTNPFKTSDVCRRCNNVCGLFVDTAFIKNWFTQAGRSEAARQNVIFDQNAIFPLMYMGVIRGLTHETKICELWLGPTGDRICHFHDPYPEVEDMPLLVGPAPNVRDEIDPGFAFIFVVPSNPLWWRPILRSFAAQFTDTTLFLGNGPPPPGGLFSQIPHELNDLHTRLTDMAEETHPVRFTMTMGFETRFLAKLALGMGHLHLKPEFASSADADLLRSMMWERHTENRRHIPVRGTGFFGRENPLPEIGLSWPFGHTIALLPNSAGLALYVRFYDQQTSVIRITANQQHWHEMIPEEGIVYAVSAGIRRFVGPVSLPDFIAHRLGVSTFDNLSSLEREAGNIPQPPPLHVDED